MAEHCRTASAQSLMHTLEGKAPLRPPACLGGNYVLFPKLYEPSCQSDTQEITGNLKGVKKRNGWASTEYGFRRGIVELKE